MGGMTSRRRIPRKPRARRIAKRATPETAELQNLDDVASEGLSRSNWSRAQVDALAKPFHPTELEITRDGSVNIPPVQVYVRLNQVFQPGNWALAIRGDPEDKGDDELALRVRLYVNGVPVGEAFGKGTLGEDRDWGDAVEAARTNGLKRCTKHFLAMPCWERLWCAAFVSKWGWFVETAGGVSAWRHSLGVPLWDEVGLDPRSPNQDAYSAPTLAQRAAVGPRPSRKRVARDKTRAAELVEPEAIELPINMTAIRQMMTAARTHSKSDRQIKRFILDRWGYESKKQIRASQFTEVLAWVRAPGATKKPQGRAKK